MPSLGADMDEGTLTEWLVRSGDHVHRGEPVAVVETAKSTIEVECFYKGIVTDLLVEPGTTVPVGTPLALIGSSERARPTRHAPTNDKPSEPAAPEHLREPSSSPLASVPAPVPSAAQLPAHTEAGPLARHLAERSGVDLGGLHGSGPGGRVTRADVEDAAAARPGTAPSRARATALRPAARHRTGRRPRHSDGHGERLGHPVLGRSPGGARPGPSRARRPRGSF